MRVLDVPHPIPYNPPFRIRKLELSIPANVLFPKPHFHLTFRKGLEVLIQAYPKELSTRLRGGVVGGRDRTCVSRFDHGLNPGVFLW
ncbi:MAG: hypothetical protein K1Y36_13495 [Blastocatellia bacterium]|nr:hypothetical protein [Blastocatellia bacterium]